MTDEDYAKVHMTPERLAAEIQEHCDWIADCLADVHTSWSPKLVIHAKAGPDAEEQIIMILLAVEFNEQEEKIAILDQIGVTVYEQQLIPLAVLLSTEAWLSTSRQGVPHVQPRDDPARQEVIVVQGLTMAKDAATTTALVERGEGDRIQLGAFGPVRTEGVRCQLLEHFYRCFWRATQARQTGRN